ncbi:hypothetical protein FNF28_04178 [Cafeteria roenbergensis]|uniref:Uncharacterized protein n=1 Tax=Cafeteria roenbergensis TaxID=33653 RepID=A0A5A8DIB5_CAFRO|nr:hypothetical protein FNF28_04178 [Cafeteria roenbergensis]
MELSSEDVVALQRYDMLAAHGFARAAASARSSPQGPESSSGPEPTSSRVDADAKRDKLARAAEHLKQANFELAMLVDVPTTAEFAAGLLAWLADNPSVPRSTGGRASPPAWLACVEGRCC